MTISLPSLPVCISVAMGRSDGGGLGGGGGGGRMVGHIQQYNRKVPLIVIMSVQQQVCGTLFVPRMIYSLRLVMPWVSSLPCMAPGACSMHDYHGLGSCVMASGFNVTPCNPGRVYE